MKDEEIMKLIILMIQFTIIFTLPQNQRGIIKSNSKTHTHQQNKTSIQNLIVVEISRGGKIIENGQDYRQKKMSNL